MCKYCSNPGHDSATIRAANHNRPTAQCATTGVVIWAAPARNLAVIWCSDHDRLAYASAASDLRDQESWPRPGDLVGFSLDEIKGQRHCRDLHLISADWHPELAESLRGLGEPSGADWQAEALEISSDGQSLAPCAPAQKQAR